jgi:hypothetical protein
MRRIVLAAVLMLAPIAAKAQVEFQFTNFQSTATGFSATLLFRNLGDFSASQIIAIDQLSVGLAQRVLTYCAPSSVACILNSGSPQHLGMYSVGNVQLGNIPFEITSSCVTTDCLVAQYNSPAVGVLPCQMPASIVNAPVPIYAARTCGTVGFDGWLAHDFSLSVMPFNTLDPLPAFTFLASDITAQFTTEVLAGPNVAIAPEPSTWLLMASGLLAIGAIARRRRMPKSRR